jgi:3-deoxy-manno-octulosonate cytidylyltransferase (CMP-KDO synthetase)
MKTAAVIPCRLLSTRFERKPLATIGGKPMMWHVYQQASKANSIDATYIATDSLEIGKVCDDLNMKWIMTSNKHLTGTDRVAECARMLDVDIIVNIQGDEPFIQPESVNTITKALLKTTISDLAVVNGYSVIDLKDEIYNPNVVKVIFSTSNHALAYSRLPIPLEFKKDTTYYRQLGIYAFYKDALKFFAATNQGPIEQSESIEMYRFIEHDKPVLMVPINESGISVDNISDLYNARQIYKTRERIQY